MTTQDVVLIAKVALLGHEIHEGSWFEQQAKYLLNEREAFEQACKQLDVPVELAELLDYANHWTSERLVRLESLHLQRRCP